ncbi:hypothetical protein [Microbacterium aerolatum]|uniref:Uncharacterized protein n=1 Tax=Microbacterium aerolatum TaxID=153731 RepID=A0A511AB04_9MICO|nr:hypothetical protein [Microbacterium aerolatum]GEK85186.1 hypothetical protein MAE01_03620 [Microbacterium aerolatum]GGB28853.1 hypothetical protein GCM10007198_19190 [Microbacterium aerolatum]
MTSDPYRPVVAVDVDGVLRVPNAKPGLEFRDGIITAEITMSRAAYPTLFHAMLRPDDPDEWTETHSFSGIGADWIRNLINRGVEVVWATTWLGHANTYFAPALGVPSLPVGVVDDGWSDWSSASWKSRQLGSNWAGRPLLWVDDVPVLYPEARLDRLRRPVDRALTRSFIVPNPTFGIRAADVQILDEWLALTSTEAGQRELRRQRQLQFRRRRDRFRRERWGTEAAYRRWRKYRRALNEVLAPDSVLGSTLTSELAEHEGNLSLAEIAFLRKEWGDRADPPAEELLRVIESVRRLEDDASTKP